MIQEIDGFAQRLRLELLAKITLILGMVVLVWYAFDRDPPFAVLEVPKVSASPGEWIKVVAVVRRDAHRGCDASMSRYIYDSENVRFDMGSSLFSAAQIEGMERRHPGTLPLAFKLPESISPGPARLVSVLEYRCNKLHRLFPIPVTTEIPFAVE